MGPKLVRRSAFSIVGMQIHVAGDPSAIPDLWRAVISRSEEIGDALEEGAFGVTCNHDPVTREFDYVAGFGVPQPGHIPEGMTSVDIPAGEYAELVCTLPTMMDTLHRALHEWLPTSGFTHTGGPEVELYPPAFDPAEPGSEFYYYVPLVAR
jgi:predicted transcriptional regulator YdeE